MNNWLQNIKGQITELATEVLHEAAEEGQVSTSSELQVEKKNRAEAEHLLLVEKGKTEALEKKLQELEEQLYSSNVENDAIKEKFMGMVSDRDEQIKRLNNELERLKLHAEEGEFQHISLGSPPPKVDPFFASTTSKEAEIENAIAHLKEKHEHEIATLMSVNASNLKQLRDQYEQRIHELESWSLLDSQSSNTASSQKLASESNEPSSFEKEQQFVELQKDFQRIQSELEIVKQQKEQMEAERTAQGEEIRRLRALNSELMASYNEASSQLEEAKSGDHAQRENITDLSSKIASLKTALNETETRYELCKMEQAETGSRLEQLMKEFHELRSGMHAARASAEGTEQELMAEIHSLRDSLKSAIGEREKLLADYSQSMRQINEEMAQIRQCNQRLVEENAELGETVAQFERLRDDLNTSTEELATFRAKFSQMQSNYMGQVHQLSEERDELRQRIEELQKEQSSQGVEKECQVVATESSSDTITTNETLLEQCVAQLKAELRERDEELQRMKSEQRMLMVGHQAEEHFKRPSSDTDESAASNNDWERMGKEEIDVEGVSSSVASEEKGPPPRNGKGEDEGTQTEENVREENIPLDEQTQQLARKLAQTEEELEESMTNLQEITAELDEFRRQKREGEINAEGLEREIDHLTNERDRLETLRIENEGQIDMLKAEFEKLKSILNVQANEQEVTELSTRLESLEAQLVKSLESNAHLAAANGDLLADNERLKQEIGKIGEKCEELQGKLAEEEANTGRIIEEFEQRTEELARMADRNSELEAKLAEIEQTNMAEQDQIRERMSQMADRNRELEENLAKHARIEEQLARMTDRNQELETKLAEVEQINLTDQNQIREQMAKMADRNKKLEAKLSDIEQINMADQGQTEIRLVQQTEELSQIRAENEELKALLQQKHAECQEYYAKLQELHTNSENKELKLRSAEETLQRREQEIALNRERIAKLDSELHRLREHLLTIEEISSKEAIAAEERETDLRQQIRQLQEKWNTDETSIANSLEQYQAQIGELNSNVTALETDRAQLASTLTEREAELRDMHKTLGNLQMVLKELADDQKRERQQFDAEMRRAQADLAEAKIVSATHVETNQKLEEELANVRENLAQMGEQMSRKEALLEELENQMEETRMSRNEEGHSFSPSDPSSASGGGKGPVYKIDDATLRQLFFSYFTADKSKQPEIALVMSRILGYSPEEQSQIHKALQQASSSSGSSWFGFGGASSPAHGPSGGQQSLTEQFIRFLEQESMARAAQSITLPVHTDPTQFGTGFLIGDAPPPVPPTSSASSSDLKSILDQ